jgi:hypothetical protein
MVAFGPGLTYQGETLLALVFFSPLNFLRMFCPSGVRRGRPGCTRETRGCIVRLLAFLVKAERQARPAVGRGIGVRNLEGGLPGRSLLPS